MIPLDEFAWTHLQKIEIVSPQVYSSLCKRMENKKLWAENMLRSEQGLETLLALFGSSKNREKGLKILNKYSYLKEELVDRMKKLGPGVERWLE